MFEKEFEVFLEEQMRTASGARLERLKKDLVGEKKMLSVALWPVLNSFDGLILEYEFVSSSGVKIYIDAYYDPLRFGFESEGFAVHAETITRDRYDFERMRARTMAMYNIKYVPFTWDELDKKPEMCRRTVYELLGRYSAGTGPKYLELSVYEREVIRYALRLNRPFRLGDVCDWLQLGPRGSRVVLRKLLDRQLIRPTGQGKQRFHEYTLEDRAVNYLL